MTGALLFNFCLAKKLFKQNFLLNSFMQFVACIRNWALVLHQMIHRYLTMQCLNCHIYPVFDLLWTVTYSITLV